MLVAEVEVDHLEEAEAEEEEVEVEGHLEEVEEDHLEEVGEDHLQKKAVCFEIKAHNLS